MLLRIGHMEDFVNLLEPAPEVKSISYLPYALHHPEWSHKPSSELPSACYTNGLRGELHFFSYQMLLQHMVLV